ncbi:MAG: Protein GrpE [Parcubacteria group bacterium GW2011_GWB1_57_6]|nr:MAG: Protein GrpE [Parcubacteria group bacterium GW2011_GWA1_56_13]KKW46477.1 MAG: Protein GrpE [Parcubacteria group bacterium GW2011_GWB1_57_6]
MDEDEVKIIAEDPEASGGSEDPESPEGASAKVKKLREELGACRKEKQEYMDGWQRAKADYINALKRFEGDVKTAELAGKIKAVETLLPAFDALERAKEHGEISQGFLAIARQLESAFAALGLEEVGHIGGMFDPALHEAFGQDTVDSMEADNTITALLEKGWRIGPTVIRPAKVRVGHFDQVAGKQT